MENLRSFIFGNRKNDEEESVVRDNQNDCTPETFKDATNDSTSPVASPDPKVVEYFKDFPEPYRQKAIDRFSKREGFYKWDFFRETAMHQEMQQAKRGIFLEDKREFDEQIRQSQEEDLERLREDAKKNFNTREISEWERQVLNVIPLQPGDHMGLKLVQTTSASALGLTFFWTWARFRKTNPSRFALYRSLVGSIGVFAGFQALAVARLMDLGPFDSLKDDRHFLTKTVEEIKNDFKVVTDYLDERMSKR